MPGSKPGVLILAAIVIHPSDDLIRRCPELKCPYGDEQRLRALPFPSDLRHYLVIDTGIGTGAKTPDAAKSLSRTRTERPDGSTSHFF
jgi:hypothetical protein